MISESFVSEFNKAADYINSWADRKGFNNSERNIGEVIALMHSELSEALEGARHGNPPDDKIPQFSTVEAEYADTIIRIMHDSARCGYRVGDAIVAKMAMNEGRPYMHGKKF